MHYCAGLGQTQVTVLAGALDGVDAGFGMHVMPSIPTGHIVGAGCNHADLAIAFLNEYFCQLSALG